MITMDPEGRTEWLRKGHAAGTLTPDEETEYRLGVGSDAPDAVEQTEKIFGKLPPELQARVDALR